MKRIVELPNRRLLAHRINLEAISNLCIRAVDRVGRSSRTLSAFSDWRSTYRSDFQSVADLRSRAVDGMGRQFQDTLRSQ